MYTIKKYCKASSLEQAYELLQKSRNNTLVGGNLWLRLGNRNINNLIDLSGLGLNQIEETEYGFRIGCMVTLRQLEMHQSLNEWSHNLFYKAIRHIVGVQFRNCATVGGSIFPRFGFSDVLTAFLACDSTVDLYKKGQVALSEFIDMPPCRDILTHILIKKDNRRVEYASFRMTETDFPVLTCSVIKKENTWSAVIGARPGCARLSESEGLPLPSEDKKRETLFREIAEQFDYGDNMRGSAHYRRELAAILIKRCFENIE